MNVETALYINVTIMIIMIMDIQAKQLGHDSRRQKAGYIGEGPLCNRPTMTEGDNFRTLTFNS